MNFWQLNPFMAFWFPFMGLNYRHEQQTPDGVITTPFVATPTRAGEIVTIDKSMRLSVVWACVSLRSRIIGSMPLHIKDDKRKMAVDSPLYDLLHASPNNDMTPSDLWALVSLQLDLWGNAYILINRQNKKISSLTPLSANKVAPRRNKDGTVSYLLYKDRQKTEEKQEYSENDILHFRGMSFDGF
ncbi:MAG: phage portal protein, partial [Neisseriaceae bacterium]|nr:phage portal protein [Neisseriaceae bacterium]